MHDVAILPIVSIAVPSFGLTHFILRILKGNPQKKNYNRDYKYIEQILKP